MDVEILVVGPPVERRYTLRATDTGATIAEGRLVAGGEAAAVVAGGQVVGRIEYGPMTPPERSLRPRSIDPGSTIPFELRGDAGIAYQPRSAIVRPRARTVVVELGGRRRELYKPLGRLVLTSEHEGDTEVRWARGVGRATAPDQRSLELLALLLAGQVTRHLSALTM